MIDLDINSIKADYDRDGFVIIRDFLNDNELHELRERAIPLAHEILIKEGHTENYRNLAKSLHQHDAWFDEQLSNGVHVPLMRHLMGEEVVGLSAAWFDRPTMETQGVSPHVDAINRNHYPDAGATIWIALDHVNKGNGCLHYLQYSHKGDYPHMIPIPGIDTESEDVFAAELNAGDVVIHNALTVHWSGGNSTDEPRRAVSYFYFSATGYAALHERKEA